MGISGLYQLLLRACLLEDDVVVTMPNLCYCWNELFPSFNLLRFANVDSGNHIQQKLKVYNQESIIQSFPLQLSLFQDSLRLRGNTCADPTISSCEVVRLVEMLELLGRTTQTWWEIYFVTNNISLKKGPDWLSLQQMTQQYRWCWRMRLADNTLCSSPAPRTRSIR